MKTSSILILLVISVLSFKAYSAPLSCGNVREIRCPFQLKGDNQNCKGSSYEFSCENNRTILHLSPDNMQYFVEDINYDNSSLLVVDPGIKKDNYSSLPLYSMQEEPSIRGNIPLEYLNQPVTFLSCHTPAVSSQYINITSIASSSLYKYSYVVTGRITLSQVEGDCEVTKLAWVSREWPILKTDNYLTINFSELPITNFSELHDGMAYGFKMDWSKIFCASCNLRVYSLCQALNAEYTCFYDCDLYDITTDAFLPLCEFTIGLPFLLAVLVYRLKKRHLSVYDSIEDFLQGQNNLTPIRYSYSDIKKITNGFRDKLGEGGFGSVYKGELRSGLVVAVKIMGKSNATAQEFMNEVATIGRIHHVNIVELIGFCFQGSKRALIYEFMPNGSLEKYIFPENEDEHLVSLSCEKMYQISYKVAKGIDYLHRGCDMQILHFDIKPHNILLDKNFNPKISDFGLAKLYASGDSFLTLTAARGTIGYMAPELFYKNIGGVSLKADVYSYGMLLMEMASRRKNSNPIVNETSQVQYPLWVFDEISAGNEIEIEDADEEEKKLVKKMIIVALWCIQMRPSERPSMHKVIEMLEGDADVLRMPPKPFLHLQEEQMEDQELISIYSSTIAN
ncbi:hypothetical protein DCAR_0626107 [Daucus carota subsp. sativus]|uniref:Protein kinase domain-containing protein n=1 Tax=Daucus carota subsp. sativus TaxID=79200 RepID=A0AAF1B4U7_DAUCS|nr:hypothetical protein DCAR_0626107 [Daucus carota subsp. sativus]